jgi:hypothetical protein
VKPYPPFLDGDGNDQPAFPVFSGDAVQKAKQRLPGLRLQGKVPQGFPAHSRALPVFRGPPFPAASKALAFPGRIFAAPKAFTFPGRILTAAPGVPPAFPVSAVPAAGRLRGKVPSRDHTGVAVKTFRAQLHPLVQGGDSGERAGLPERRIGIPSRSAAGDGIAGKRAGDRLPPDIGKQGGIQGQGKEFREGNNGNGKSVEGEFKLGKQGGKGKGTAAGIPAWGIAASVRRIAAPLRGSRNSG